MTYRLRVRSKAFQDIANIAKWYGGQQPGLGSDFILCFDAAIEGIKRHPMMNAEYYHEYRRAFVRRFPVGIFYIVKGDLISIVSVRDLRQDPKTIIRSLG